MAHDVLRHRLVLSYEALADGAAGRRPHQQGRWPPCPSPGWPPARTGPTWNARPDRVARPPRHGRPDAGADHRAHLGRPAARRRCCASSSWSSPAASTGCSRATTWAWCPGHGTEPGETRVYVEGDDVRRIDWNVTARTTVPHVRDAIADRELETWALVDCSASLDFGTALCEKRDLALAAVAAVGFLTARTGNRMGAVIVRPDGTSADAGPPRPPGPARPCSTPSPPGPGSRAAGATDLAAALESLLRPPRRRGLTVVVSDFLAPPGWERPLRALCRPPPGAGRRGRRPPGAGAARRGVPHPGGPRDRAPCGRCRRPTSRCAAATRRRPPPSGPPSPGRSAGRAPPTWSCAPTGDWLRDIVGFVLMARRKRDALARARR